MLFIQNAPLIPLVPTTKIFALLVIPASAIDKPGAKFLALNMNFWLVSWSPDLLNIKYIKHK